MKLATHQRELLNRCSSSPSVITLMLTGLTFGLAWYCFFSVLLKLNTVAFCWWYIVVYAGVQGIKIGHSAFDIIAYRNMCLWVFGEHELALRKSAHDEIFKLTVNAATCSAQIALSLKLLTYAGILLTCLVANWWILFCVYAAIVFIYTSLRLVCMLLVRSYVKKVTPRYIFSDSPEHNPYTCVKDFFPDDFTWTPKFMTSMPTTLQNKQPVHKAKRVRLNP